MQSKPLPRTKLPPIAEYCINQECKTPKCPYRIPSKKLDTSVAAQDFSKSCDYYSAKGDGRYEKKR